MAHDALTRIELHALLGLHAGPSYGYRLLKAIEAQSGGEVSPDIGALYRALGRLMESGLVEETDAPDKAPETTRGRPRRYYALTPVGIEALAEERRRLRDLLDLVDRRMPAIEG